MKLVMIVEDEYAQAEVLQLLLEAHGYRVALATDGQAALQLCERETPALMLSDFMMPVMNGASLGVTVRCHAALADVPFVIMSGTSEPVVRALFADYDAFLCKPIEPGTALELIARFVTEGRAARFTTERNDGLANPLFPFR